MLDFYAIGVAIYPYTMAEYYAMQEAAAQTPEGGEGETVDLDK